MVCDRGVPMLEGGSMRHVVCDRGVPMLEGGSVCVELVCKCVSMISSINIIIMTCINGGLY